jgi:iron complex transport system substrate-binding protein
MRHLLPKLIFIVPFFLFVGCKKNETAEVAKTEIAKNSIEYASGLSIIKHE